MERTTNAPRLVAAACLALVAACGSAAPSAGATTAGKTSVAGKTTATGKTGVTTKTGVTNEASLTVKTTTTAADQAGRTTEGAAWAASAADAVARCRTTGLRARVAGQDAGAGQRYAKLVLTNASPKTCWVYGFAGLIMIDGNGDALRTRTRRENARPQRVTLRPGASAHAGLHWTVVPSGSETRCPASARLMIIPPDEVAHLEVPFRATACGDGRIDVTPMAPGAGL
jgi:hypothetical protein